MMLKPKAESSWIFEESETGHKVLDLGGLQLGLHPRSLPPFDLGGISSTLGVSRCLRLEL